MDPRLYQIAALSGLLIYGLFWLKFDLSLAQALLSLGAALGTQWLCSRWRRIAFDPKSALISGLSLCLLLRTSSLWIAVLAAFIAIGSKFVLRLNGKHLFNPTNFGLVALMLLLGDRVWVSPGQWGNVAFFGFLMACIGGLVVNRAARSDVTFAFLICYISLIVGRSLWVGEPMTIPFHRLQSGGLLLFAFFMVSDPKTTPNARAGRILFAALVAFGAWYWQFRLFHTNGLLWSLAVFALVVPVIDMVLRGDRYVWKGSAKTEPQVAAAS
ncbi:MAG TPA: RnfABCDGE type electron transport complex subunit D [Chthoniobacteraceae bacterium]|jgi:Na+-transporting NADH:ubiquinone oxidoreductase subunit NqrB|nr:RnfABCDGE type electron transport complex subunit D [Chthoniobacteraceae bacterium]